MLKLEGVALRRGPKLLFEDVSLQAHAGQRIGLVGANGSGKSSLFDAIRGALETERGDIRLAAGMRLAHVRQESPSGSCPALQYVLDGDEELRDVQRQIESAERRANDESLHALYERLEQIGGHTAAARAGRLLYGLGFSETDSSRPVDEFSGGWRMRLALARALMCRSDLLLLDEPTNHLDLPAILWLQGWLQRYPGILLLVSHDRDFLDALCTHIAHIEHGGICLFSGDYSRFEALHAGQLARQEALHRRQQAEIRHIQSYVDRFRYKASKARQAQSRLKMLERMKRIAPAHIDSPFDFHFAPPDKASGHLACLENITAGYDEPILRSVRLDVTAGDRIGLLGANGAGKSTLVKALADGSTVLAGERRIGKGTVIGYFAQHQLEALDPALSPLQHLRALDPDTRESEQRNYLGRFGFGDERIFDPVAPFSGGEKSRLVLALLVRQRPNLLLLDEPTNHLDLEMRQALSRALLDFDGAVVLISHDRYLLRSVCDELLVVHGGTLSRFDRDIEQYPAWLVERASRSAQPLPSRRAPQAESSRRRRRQLDAGLRLRMKPLTDRVRAIESRLEELRSDMQRLERLLADETLYADAARQDEIAALARDRAGAEAEIEALESEWLEASEAVEQARSAPADA